MYISGMNLSRTGYFFVHDKVYRLCIFSIV